VTYEVLNHIFFTNEGYCQSTQLFLLGILYNNKMGMRHHKAYILYLREEFGVLCIITSFL